MYLFLNSTLLKNTFSLTDKLSKILFLFFITSLLSTAYGSNIERCPGSNVKWDKCFGTFEHPEIKVSGEWLNGRLYGYAVLKAKTYVYLGDVKDSKFHGYGVLYNNVTRCSGQFLDDKKNGQGVCYWDDGSKYIGEFKNDEFHGRGVLYRPDGSIRQGIYEDGKLVKEAKVDILSFEKISDSNWGSVKVRIEKFLVNFIKPGMTKDEIRFGLDMFWADQEIRFSSYLAEKYAGVKLIAFGSTFGSLNCGKPSVYPFRLDAFNKSLTSEFDYGKKFDLMYFDDAGNFLKFITLEDYTNELKWCHDAGVEIQKKLADARAVESQKKWSEKRKKILEDLKPFASRAKPHINLNTTCFVNGYCSITVVSSNDEPFGVFRIVFNNKIGVGECDYEFLSYLTTGDSVSVDRVNRCGEEIVKIEIFTDRGNIVKRRVGRGINEEWK